MVGAGYGHSKASGGGGGESKACRDAVLVALDLEELEKRVAACEEADQLMQVGYASCTAFCAPWFLSAQLHPTYPCSPPNYDGSRFQVAVSGVNKEVPKSVDDALNAQLAARLAKLMGPGGELSALVNKAVAGMADRIKVWDSTAFINVSTLWPVPILGLTLRS